MSRLMFAVVVILLMLTGAVGSVAAASVYCSSGAKVESADWYFKWNPPRINEHNNFHFDCGEYTNLTVINVVTDTKYWNGTAYTYGSSVPIVKYYHSMYPTAYSYTYMNIGDSVTLHYCNNGRHWQSTFSTNNANYWLWGTLTFIYSNESLTEYKVSGETACIDWVKLYIKNHDGNFSQINYTESANYEFEIIDGLEYMLIFSDGAYHDFICTGNEAFDYDACIWVYGYTCGIDTIKLYKDDGGWVLDDSVGQATGYDVYEIPIVDGVDYKISFIDSGTAVHNQTFSCTGDNVLIDFDRCNWVYPPSPWADPYIIYLWTGYDYNIVVFKDEHGNFIENSQLAIYDKTDNQYLQRWTDASDGYTLLGARFNTDHDVRLSIRTFDGIFTLDTTCPANGSAAVGEEDITTTNWTIPIKYNLNIQPVDQYAVPLFDVFCGLSEYTPLNPGAFWGMDLSDRGYVPVTNCSGFAMCDIIAEKAGYADYKVEALNWTSKSALVKDYRHNIVMEEE